MARLPNPGGDDNTWGDILNGFLAVAHNPDGTLKDSGLTADQAPGTASIRTLGYGTNQAAQGSDVNNRLTDLESDKVSETLIEDKGDLLVGLSDDTIGRINVGTDGQILTADAANVNGVVWADNDALQPGSAAGGVLSGTYPNPGFASDMATQAELDAHAADTTAVHGIANTSLLETTAGSQAKVDTHVNDTSDAHDASAISVVPTGSLTQSDVQAALAGATTRLDSVESSDAGKIAASLIDAKGDLIVGSADNTVIRKAVGTDGQVLTADAVSTGGVKWAAVIAGASLSANQTFTGVNTFAGPGAQFVDADVGASARTFGVSPRVGDAGSNVFTFPVVSFYPTTAAKRLALDLMPSAGASQDPLNGMTWLDVCNTNTLNSTGGAVGVARVSAFTDHVEFGSHVYNGASTLDLWIAANSTGSSTPQIFINGTTGLVSIFSKTQQANTMLTVVPPASNYIPLVATGVTSQSADLFATYLTLNGTRAWSVGNTGIPKWGNANGQTTVGAAGAASALPATPSRYLKVVGDDGTSYVIPAYAAA